MRTRLVALVAAALSSGAGGDPHAISVAVPSGDGLSGCDCAVVTGTVLNQTQTIEAMNKRLQLLEMKSAPTTGIASSSDRACPGLEAFERRLATMETATRTVGGTDGGAEVAALRSRVAELEQRELERKDSVNSLQQHLQELLFSMGLVQVKVPAGYTAGTQLKVRVAGGHVVAVTIPPGASEGDIIRSRLPESMLDKALATP